MNLARQKSHNAHELLPHHTYLVFRDGLSACRSGGRKMMEKDSHLSNVDHAEHCGLSVTTVALIETLTQLTLGDLAAQCFLSTCYCFMMESHRWQVCT